MKAIIFVMFALLVCSQAAVRIVRSPQFGFGNPYGGFGGSPFGKFDKINKMKSLFVYCHSLKLFLLFFSIFVQRIGGGGGFSSSNAAASAQTFNGGGGKLNIQNTEHLNRNVIIQRCFNLVFPY